MQNIKWFLLIEKDYILAIRDKGLHFCITELQIRPNCSDYLWPSTKLVDYLLNCPEVSDNHKDKPTLVVT